MSDDREQPALFTPPTDEERARAAGLRRQRRMLELFAETFNATIVDVTNK